MSDELQRDVMMLARQVTALEGRIDTHEKVCEQIRRTEQEYRFQISGTIKELKETSAGTTSLINKLDHAFDSKLAKVNDKMLYALTGALSSTVLLSAWLMARALGWT